MDFPGMIATLRGHPEFRKMGMIASHLGVVRGSSRDGREVTGIEVAYDHDRLRKIVEEMKMFPGIVDIRVEIREGRLEVGDEILAVAVGGDIRENVFNALVKTVDRIKTEASRKRELFA
jgi:molybdopterin synthase catalytic subunit